jgi:hypothetical protein
MENGASAAAQVIIAIIPIVAIVMGCSVVFFYLLWTHRERMLRIDKGSYAPVPLDIDAFSLLSGILLVAVGLTLTIVFIAMASAGFTLLGGLIPLSVGIGLLVFHLMRRTRRQA